MPLSGASDEGLSVFGLQCLSMFAQVSLGRISRDALGQMLDQGAL